MKVFFTSSVRGIPLYAHYYTLIHQQLEKLHYIHVDSDIVTAQHISYYYNLEQKGKKATQELFKKKIAAIQKADVCIFEVSLPSTSIGFLISKSIESHKPTINLYLASNTPYFLQGIPDEKVITAQYEEATLEKTLNQVLAQAQKKRDQRFNFFINTDLIDYLEKAAQQKKISKSLYIRKLLEQSMKKNKQLLPFSS